MRYIGFDILTIALVVFAAWLSLQQHAGNLEYLGTVIILALAVGIYTCKRWCMYKDELDGVE